MWHRLPCILVPSSPLDSSSQLLQCCPHIFSRVRALLPCPGSLRRCVAGWLAPPCSSLALPKPAAHAGGSLVAIRSKFRWVPTFPSLLLFWKKRRERTGIIPVSVSGYLGVSTHVANQSDKENVMMHISHAIGINVVCGSRRCTGCPCGPRTCASWWTSSVNSCFCLDAMTIFLAVWHLHSFSINYELSVLNYEEPSLDELAGRVFGQHQVQTRMLKRVCKE